MKENCFMLQIAVNKIDKQQAECSGTKGEEPDEGQSGDESEDNNLNFDHSRDFSFGDQNILLRPDARCHVCGSDHNDLHCPALQTFFPLVDLFPRFRAILDQSIELFYEKTRLSKEKQVIIKSFIEKLEKILQKKFRNDSLRLKKFGSLINGFGHNNCDLDLCLCSNDPTFDDIDDATRQEFIQRIYSALSKLDEFRGLKRVLTAKVPILKFVYPKSELMGDISISNKLALHNSRMLATYVRFDERLAKLGFFLKRWAKELSMNDSHSGTFSSYSLNVMLIFYLQRCKPTPLLPFLQEEAIIDGVVPKEVDGWSVAFSQNVDRIFVFSKANWPHNSQSVGELFRGFLAFFSDLECFNPATDVIQIRESKCRDKARSFPIIVEDPFDLDHNLTAGVRKHNLNRMRAAIKWTLRKIDSMDDFVRMNYYFRPKNDRENRLTSRRPLPPTPSDSETEPSEGEDLNEVFDNDYVGNYEHMRQWYERASRRKGQEQMLNPATMLDQLVDAVLLNEGRKRLPPPFVHHSAEAFPRQQHHSSERRTSKTSWTNK